MKRYQSIRWQLMAWQRLLLATVLIILLSLHYHLRKKSEMAEVDAGLQNAFMEAMPGLSPLAGGRPGGGPGGGPPPHGPDLDSPPPWHNQDSSASPTAAAKTYLENIEAEGYYLISWNESGEVIDQYGAVPESIAPNDYNFIAGEQDFFSHEHNRELVVAHHQGLLFVMGRPLTDIDLILAQTRRQLLLVGLLVFLIGHVGGWIIIRRTLEPIKKISQTAEEIARGEHSRRIELSSAPEELAGLAQTLNNSFNHLDTALENQIRFSADASHELRTPIAVVMAQTQAALKRERSIEEYKAVLEACLRAGQRMKAMADSLLELTRINGNTNILNATETPLNEVFAGVAEEATHLSEAHPVSFQSLETPVSARIDAERIHQVLMNLISNAVKHNPEGCPISITQKTADGWAEIEVADEGSGIPEDALPHIFDRFYRVDQSRSRESGGTGLGLSIVKSIIENHGGTIAATSELGKGTTFSIRLPLNG